jgi:hypothetical protein
MTRNFLGNSDTISTIDVFDRSSRITVGFFPVYHGVIFGVSGVRHVKKRERLC